MSEQSREGNLEMGSLLDPQEPAGDRKQDGHFLRWDEISKRVAQCSGAAYVVMADAAQQLGLDAAWETVRAGVKTRGAQAAEDPAFQKAFGRLAAAAGALLAPILVLVLLTSHHGSVARTELDAAQLATTAAPTTIYGIAMPAATLSTTPPTTRPPTTAQPVLVLPPKTGLLAQLVQTSRDGDHRLQALPDVALLDGDFAFDGPTITVDLDSLQQEIVGFGGAFTEAAAVTLMKLSMPQQEEILDKYFGPDGIGYTIGRVHINSCDFSLGNYNFDSVPDDFALNNFDDNVQHDAEALIPMLQRAGSRVAKNGGEGLRILASPWSPPAWMKVSNQMNQASLPLCLRPEAADAWANYIARWTAAYKRQNVNIWAMTVQNEPQVNPGWEGCAYTPQEEGSFLADHLGPIMQAQHPEVDIFIYDDSKQNLLGFTEGVMQNPKVVPFVKGAAFHWYTGDFFDQVSAVRERFPNVMLLASEATYERRRWQNPSGAPSDNWGFGAGYAHDIIGDLNSGASGWLDWNLVLDQTGGPNHVGNSCDAAIMVDVPAQAVHVHPQFYFVAHFSKYMPPGSRLLKVDVEGTSRVYNHPDYGVCSGEDGLQAAAAARPDGKVALVVLNCGEEGMDYKVRIRSKSIYGKIPGLGIQTYLLAKSPELLKY